MSDLLLDMLYYYGIACAIGIPLAWALVYGGKGPEVKRPNVRLVKP